MKKAISVLIAISLIFSLALTALASVPNNNFNFRDGTRETITKAQYDALNGKLPANNKTTALETGINFVASNKDGWYVQVADGALKGEITVAYKIGPNYFSVLFWLDGKGAANYYVGAGSGNQGVNHVKVGAFAAHVCEFEFDSVIKAPTCTEDGEDLYVCIDERCDETEIRPTDALGHIKGAKTVVLEPTCTEKGTWEIKCDRDDCGAVLKTGKIKALGHDMPEEWTKVEGSDVLCDNGVCVVEWEVEKVCQRENCDHRVSEKITADCECPEDNGDDTNKFTGVGAGNPIRNRAGHTANWNNYEIFAGFGSGNSNDYGNISWVELIGEYEWVEITFIQSQIVVRIDSDGNSSNTNVIYVDDSKVGNNGLLFIINDANANSNNGMFISSIKVR